MRCAKQTISVAQMLDLTWDNTLVLSQTYDAALRLEPSNADAYFQRGVMKSLVKDKKPDAFEDLEKAMKLAEANHNTKLQQKILVMKNAIEQAKELHE